MNEKRLVTHAAMFLAFLAFLTPAVMAQPTIDLSVASVQFNATAGAVGPVNQTVAISNTGSPGSTLNFIASETVSWLSVSPVSGSRAAGASGNITLGVATAGLSSGTYNTTLLVTDPNATNSPKLLPVKLIIAPLGARPVFRVTPVVLNFNALPRINPAAQSISVANTGPTGTQLNFTAADNASWLSLSPLSGARTAGISGNVNVFVNSAALAQGIYQSTITLTDPNAPISPIIIPVTLTIGSALQPLDLGQMLKDRYELDDEIRLEGYEPGMTVEYVWDLAPRASALGSALSGPSGAPAAASARTTSSVWNLAQSQVVAGDYTLTVTVRAQPTGTPSTSASRSLSLVNTADGVFANVQIYPNPWKASQHTSGVRFRGLPENTTIQIFTIGGHLVKELSGSGTVPWDLRTQKGDAVASGTYLYLLKGGGSQKRGKLAIVK